MFEQSFDRLIKQYCLSQRIKILTTPWRDTQPRTNVSSVANGAVRKSFIDEGPCFDEPHDEQQSEMMKEQTEVMLQPDENGDPPEPV